MSFVPVTGPARLLVGEPPREGSVEFTDERRTIAPTLIRRRSVAAPKA